jgi:hypothetical protein
MVAEYRSVSSLGRLSDTGNADDSSLERYHGPSYRVVPCRSDSSLNKDFQGLTISGNDEYRLVYSMLALARLDRGNLP